MAAMQDSILSFDAFRADVAHVATLMPADRVFTPQKPTFHVPPGWVVLVSRANGEAVLFEAGGTVDGVGVKDLLLVRAGPVQLDITEADVPSADDYPCVVRLRLWLRLSHDAGDLRSFRATVLGSRETADAETLRRYLDWHCRRVLIHFCRHHPAADLVDGRQDDGASELLGSRLRPALLAGGLVLFQPPEVRFECDQLRRIRGEQAEIAARRELHAAVVQARRRRLSEVEEQLRALQALSEKSPGVALEALIRTVPGQGRSAIYDALWTLLPGRERTQWIVAVAGNRVLCFDPNLPDAPAREAVLEGPPGALRSVRAYRRPDGEAILLVGAARGVYRVSADDLRVRSLHTFPAEIAREFRGGVNSSAAWQDQLFATHSEAGLMMWNVSGGEAVPLLAELTRRARTVRRVQVSGRRLAFGVDDRIVTCPVESPEPHLASTFRGGRGRVTALHVVEDDIVAGDDVGDVWHWPMSDPARARRLRAGEGAPVESAKQVTVGGVSFVVFAERGAPALQVLCRKDDSYRGRFSAGEHALRRCAVAQDLLVAMTEGRDRLVLWRPGESHEPSAVIHVAAQCGATMQDVWLVTDPLVMP